MVKFENGKIILENRGGSNVIIRVLIRRRQRARVSEGEMREMGVDRGSGEGRGPDGKEDREREES